MTINIGRKKYAEACMAAVFSFVAAHAYAIDIPSENPDISMQWGNTVRYNAGWRVENRDPVLARSPSNDEGTNSFNRGDMVTNRLDLLSEFDFSYRKQLGFRISGAAWADAAFHDDVRTGPTLASRGSYFNNQFSNFTKRYHKGLSGELLDAYVFSNFELGGMPGDVKIGRHSVLWGEAVFLTVNSISHSQAPTDGLKAVTNPGIDAKELAMPIGQISANLQATPELSLSAQYYFEWRPSRSPEGGTYLAGTDFLLNGPDRVSPAPGLFLRNGGNIEPSGRGDWGLAARWRPSWLDGTVGVYYRDFTEKNPSVSLNIPSRIYNPVYPKNIQLIGMSLSKNLGGISFGSEVSYRKNQPLVSSITDGNQEGARGNTWHLLANAVVAMAPNAIWNSATLIGELGYSRWDKVTTGQNYFLGCSQRPAGDQGAGTGCVTKDALQAMVRFTPQWLSVWPGWDVSGLASYSLGLKGNSAVANNGTKNGGSYSLGATFTYNQRHDFSISYNDYRATYEPTASGVTRVTNGTQRQDRGWVVLTYKGSF
ncbi:DUF1302 domain-containing protein [Noviherbaspirillum sedimenti]|uniref:DUF1302 family protein n=1 Tax=Noviherbaspirillum sedimenti TaxID=2320865 RepID=A0A3A3G7H2_9BURK|nr:DUF1302 family protein [Noviherbaspirillum sedimenti]RJG02689.1 DUF1302 family protein [Noviherbaspirillum sedimenti]